MPQPIGQSITIEMLSIPEVSIVKEAEEGGVLETNQFQVSATNTCNHFLPEIPHEDENARTKINTIQAAQLENEIITDSSSLEQNMKTFEPKKTIEISAISSEDMTHSSVVDIAYLASKSKHHINQFKMLRQK